MKYAFCLVCGKDVEECLSSVSLWVCEAFRREPNMVLVSEYIRVSSWLRRFVFGFTAEPLNREPVLRWYLLRVLYLGRNHIICKKILKYDEEQRKKQLLLGIS
jgi:hypothetical protein